MCDDASLLHAKVQSQRMALSVSFPPTGFFFPTYSALTSKLKLSGLKSRYSSLEAETIYDNLLKGVIKLVCGKKG